jgi:hypothetical protein
LKEFKGLYIALKRDIIYHKIFSIRFLKKWSVRSFFLFHLKKITSHAKVEQAKKQASKVHFERL